jgi:serine/threonine-protein kinase RsbT
VLHVSSDLDIVTARASARELSRHIGFGSIDQARVATTVSELTRNIVDYARTGTVTLRPLERGGRQGIELEFADQGPGISDVDLALCDGYSTARGLGLGLPGAKRLMHEFEIQTAVGAGTTIVCRKWRK